MHVRTLPCIDYRAQKKKRNQNKLIALFHLHFALACWQIQVR